MHYKRIVLLDCVLQISQLVLLSLLQHFNALVRLFKLLGVVVGLLLSLFSRHQLFKVTVELASLDR